MTQLSMAPVARVGVDLSKRLYQVHAIDRSGRVVVAKPLSADRFFAWCTELPTGCLIAMEACGGAHHVARRLREGYKVERTALINRIRGLLTEFGLVFSQSPEALRKVLTDVLEDASNELTGVSRLALQRAYLHWINLDLEMKWCDERITAHVRADAQATKAAALHGIGPIGASALVASVGDFSQFANARQFGAWLGLVPSQKSTGGKASLGPITKRGDDYLRTLLIQGAKSAVMSAGKRSDRISCWLVQLKLRVGWQKAVVALANKNARILWAVLTRNQAFDPMHVPPVPMARLGPQTQPAS